MEVKVSGKVFFRKSIGFSFDFRIIFNKDVSCFKNVLLLGKYFNWLYKIILYIFWKSK